MSSDFAVVLPWIVTVVLVTVTTIYAVQVVRRKQSRIDALIAEQRLHDEALERLAATTLPAVAASVRRHEPAPIPEVAPGTENSRFAQGLRWTAERYADELRMLQSEVRDQTIRDAEEKSRVAVQSAEEAVRERLSSSARDATSGAVRSFGTSVVSLGADVSQVVSAALREHRDDEVYATLTRIDHSVQQMIRQAQSYVIVCGGLPGRRWPSQSLTDVVGGATGRVRDYLRVRSNQLDRMVISRAVEPLVHTLATLLDNALRYSPPTSYVDVGFQEGHHGVTVIVDDAGVRMNSEQMEEARQVLAGERSVDIHQLGPSPKVGFPGVAALARRYGFTVYIDGPNAYGGMRAMVYIPETLLITPPPAAPAPEPIEIPAAPIARSTADRFGAQQQNGTPQPVASVRAEPVVAAVPSPEPASDPEPEASVREIAGGGLPRRRRRATVAAMVKTSGPRTDPGLARPDIAAAWQSGSKSGRAAASEQTEGTTS
ncbi:ATP-binding protein [Nocardia asteroides]|uniref:ATP-binding protein n=1 Tax=Nocardia asteroides TaxID=1824 RepID=UPI001E3FF70C|nr:ATP-binding protein [Nocardia asteroides]UGT63933.1 sensor histidine kinase [Nocardia asteroides]